MQYWQWEMQRSGTAMRTPPVGRPWASTRGGKGSGGAAKSDTAVPVSRLATRLVQQRDVLDRHALLDALDHVVDRERADGRGGQRLHLHAGAVHGAGLARERDRPGVDVDAEVAVDV